MSLTCKFACENPRLTAEAVSAVAVPELAGAYGILGTPRLILNRETPVKGRLTEASLLNAVLGASDAF